MSTLRDHGRDASHGSPPNTDLDPLPRGSRLLHIGPYKTGSTAIQVSLREAGDRLDDHAAAYFGPERARPAAMAIGVRGAPGHRRQPPVTVWDTFVQEVRGAGDRRVCISNEALARAEPAQIRRIVDALDVVEPHVVAVVRRLDKLLPSLWQQRVKGGSPYRYHEWLQKVLDRPGEECTWNDGASWAETERTNVWYAHDTAALVRRWADVVGPERVTVVISDDRDRDLLLRTFERLLDLPHGLLEQHPDESNESLQWAEVEFVRAVNEALIVRGVPLKQRRRVVGRGLTRGLTSRPRTGEPRQSPPLPTWAVPVIQDLSAVRSEAIASLGVRVVGDPRALLTADPVTGDPTDPPPITGAIAAHGVDSLVAELLDGTAPRRGTGSADTRAD